MTDTVKKHTSPLNLEDMESLVIQTRHLIQKRRGHFTVVLHDALRTAPHVQMRHVVKWAIWAGNTGNVVWLLIETDKAIEQGSYQDALTLLHQAMDEIHEGNMALSMGEGAPSVWDNTRTVGHPGNSFYPEQAFRPDEPEEDMLPQALKYLEEVARLQKEDPTEVTSRLVAKAKKQIEDRMPF